MPAVPVSELPRHPVTAGIALLAVGATVAWMGGWDIAALTMDVRALWQEPWRLLTSALPHVGVVHLAFNVFWLWRFGARIETRFGHLWTLALMVMLAGTSALAEYAVFNGGVGLSGVGYGLLGFLTVARHHDAPLADAVDRRTIGLFSIWFGLCVLTTVTDVMPVANVAHASGWLMGLLLGATRIARWRGPAVAATAAMIGLTTPAATRFRPVLNQSPDAGQTSAWLGYRALVADDAPAAVDHYRRALRLNERAAWQYNYGLALWQTGDDDGARTALQRAIALDPQPRYRDALEALDAGLLRITHGSGGSVAPTDG